MYKNELVAKCIENICFRLQKIKEKMSSIPSICDPDTSDEENSEAKSIPKQRKEKRTKLIAPKPQRVSIIMINSFSNPLSC